mgnify:CR=1 FL=1
MISVLTLTDCATNMSLRSAADKVMETETGCIISLLTLLFPSLEFLLTLMIAQYGDQVKSLDIYEDEAALSHLLWFYPSFDAFPSVHLQHWVASQAFNCSSTIILPIIMPNYPSLWRSP